MIAMVLLVVASHCYVVARQLLGVTKRLLCGCCSVGVSRWMLGVMHHYVVARALPDGL